MVPGRFSLPEENRDRVVATYAIETALSLEEVSDGLCAEQSTGTWESVERETEDLVSRCGARAVGSWRRGDHVVLRIAFPTGNFGCSIPMLLSTVAGNLYEMGSFRRTRLLDLEFPDAFVEGFEGPSFGIDGCRELLGVTDRPLLGTIIKPNVGLSPEEFGEACYESARGGVDFVKDDELVADPGYSPISDRVTEAMDGLDRVEEETGERKMFAANVTDEVDGIVDNAEEARDAGANCLMLNFVTAGLSALRVLTSEMDLPVHCHRDMFAAFTRVPDHGVSPALLNKLVRLCGGDQAHVGSIDGKLYESNDEVVANAAPLRERWLLKSTLPVSSGGLHAGKVAANLDRLGEDVLILAGGGIHGHPGGTTAGARSMRQAMEVAAGDRELGESPEMKAALEKWSPVKAGEDGN
ncbi:MAG: Ribulose bisphosphate carboxylase [Methanonatronarchaeales archaeon]|nr:Ribulose bisphosphate carboxylase [Methanonatronarchaeales archaeon]